MAPNDVRDQYALDNWALESRKDTAVHLLSIDTGSENVYALFVDGSLDKISSNCGTYCCDYHFDSGKVSAVNIEYYMPNTGNVLLGKPGKLTGTLADQAYPLYHCTALFTNAIETAHLHYIYWFLTYQTICEV